MFGSVDSTSWCFINRGGSLLINDTIETRLTRKVRYAFTTEYEAVVQNRRVQCKSHYVLDEDNNVWSWGHNYLGELGHGDKVFRLSPKMIMALRGKNVQHISASKGCVTCITMDSRCYVFGKTGFLLSGIDKTTPTKITRGYADFRIKQIETTDSYAMTLDNLESAIIWKEKLGQK